MAIVAATVAGCAAVVDVGGLREQADAALARWADAVAEAGGRTAIAPVGELTRQLGNWETEVGDNNKRALIGGLVEPGTALPAERPPDGDVTWVDGTSARVPLIAAAQALAAIRAGTTAPSTIAFHYGSSVRR